MKELVTFGIFGVIAGLAAAQAPEVQKKTFTTKVRANKARPSPSAPPLKKQDTEGVLPRAARGGNPLQMLNSKAPAGLGKMGGKVVLPSGTGEGKGVKTFMIFFCSYCGG